MKITAELPILVLVIEACGARTQQRPASPQHASVEHFCFTPDQQQIDHDRRLCQATLNSGRTEFVEQFKLDRRDSVFLEAALACFSDPSRPPSHPGEMFPCPE